MQQRSRFALRKVGENELNEKEQIKNTDFLCEDQENDPCFSLFGSIIPTIKVKKEEELPVRKQNILETNLNLSQTSQTKKKIFGIYQEGLHAEHVLQLSYIRRRSCRQRKHDVLEQHFLTPTPRIRIHDVVPALQVKPEDLLLNNRKSSNSSNEDMPQIENRFKIIQEVKEFFHQPEKASTRWKLLRECDWHEAGQEKSNNLSIKTLCLLLEVCPSDALGNFIWDELLALVLRQVCESNHHSEEEMERFFTLLLSRDCFMTLSPKEFRIKLRKKQIRRVHEKGALIELDIISKYHQLKRLPCLSSK